MRVAVIGHPATDSGVEDRLLRHLPQNTTSLVMQKNDPLCQAIQAVAHTLRLPVAVASGTLLDNADEFLIFWDGQPDANSRLAATCIKAGKPARLIPLL